MPGLLLWQPGLCWSQEWPGRNSWKTHILGALSHQPWQFFIPPPLCQPGKAVACCSFSQTQRGRVCCVQGEAAGSWEEPLRNPSPDAGFMQIMKWRKKRWANKEQYKYQGDLKAMVSFSQGLFKDSEYLDSFSFPVRNHRIFLEIFLLSRHLSNSGSL